MKLKQFERSDLEELNGWRAKRGLDAICPKHLPENGVMVRGYACGFLYKTDSAFCLLDGFNANPDTTAEDRKEALDLITLALLEAARILGFKSVMALTQLDAIKERCRFYDFSPKGEYSLFVREANYGLHR